MFWATDMPNLETLVICFERIHATERDWHTRPQPAPSSSTLNCALFFQRENKSSRELWFSLGKASRKCEVNDIPASLSRYQHCGFKVPMDERYHRWRAMLSPVSSQIHTALDSATDILLSTSFSDRPLSLERFKGALQAETTPLLSDFNSLVKQSADDFESTPMRIRNEDDARCFLYGSLIGRSRMPAVHWTVLEVIISSGSPALSSTKRATS